MKIRPTHILKTLTLGLSLSFSLNSTLEAKKPTATWAHEASDIKPDVNVHYGKLENGMKYIIMRNEDPPNRVSMRLHIAAGSLMEREDQRGVAHFLEHMVFNGSKNSVSYTHLTLPTKA